MPVTNNLPSFYRLNPERDFATITPVVDNTGAQVGYSSDRDTNLLLYTSPAAIYNHVRDELGVEAAFTNETFAAADGAYLGEGMYIDNTDGEMLVAYDPARELTDAQEEYAAFLTKRTTYLADPTAYIDAYEFISAHPIFWFYTTVRDRIFWTHEGYLHQVNPLSVYRDDEDGIIHHLIEPVCYVQGNEQEEKVLDTNLVVIADSYEQAIIALAKRIERYYDETGTARLGVANTDYTQHLIDRIDTSTEA